MDALSRARFRANRAASEAANAALLSTPIPADHPSQREPGETPPPRSAPARPSRTVQMLLGTALALGGALNLPPPRTQR